MKRFALIHALLFVAAISWGVSNSCTTPILPHDDASIEREFQNLYQCANNPVSSTGTVQNLTVKNLTISGGMTGITGRILQVQAGSLSTTFSTTSNAFQATGLFVNIKPSSTSNTILILVMGELGLTNTATVPFATIERDGSNLGPANGFCAYDTGAVVHGPCSMVYNDAPASASTMKYEVYIRSQDNTNNVRWNVDSVQTRIYAFEIGQI